ncbi:MAG: protein kinase [Halobacteriovoraceae bacterium]|nr:protein kinase [Halobacteriovoraceae bacterium]
MAKKNKNLGIKILKGKIEAFNFPPGKIISHKYKIISKLGGGWEGEVYKVEEMSTGITRAAKFFKPHRNIKNQSAKLYAKKLFKLKSCPIVIQYITQDKLQFWGREVTYLISDYIEGRTLDSFLKKQKGKRLTPFQAVLLLHALVKGLEEVHANREYHGDLHLDNIIVQKYGLGFDLKVLDMFHWGKPISEDYKDDLCNAIRVFYDSLGGQKSYSKLPDQIKYICGGLKRSLITKRFKNMSELRIFLENLNWEQNA